MDDEELETRKQAEDRIRQLREQYRKDMALASEGGFAATRAAAALQELALLAGKFFVTVEEEKGSAVYGVMSGFKTPANNLLLSLSGRATDEITITTTYGEVTQTFEISLGQRFDLRIQTRGVLKTEIIRIRAFASQQEAREWVALPSHVRHSR